MEYEFWCADCGRYLEATGHPSILSGTKAALSYPLMFDPGERWGYGPSIDWLGQAVEAVDGRRIDQFCQEEIFDPLGMGDTAFEPDAMADRLKVANVVRKRFHAFAMTPSFDGREKKQDLPASLYRHGRDALIDRITIDAARAAGAGKVKKASRLAKRRGWVKKADTPDLPVSGGDIVARGIEPGPQVGAVLSRLEDAWLASGCTLSREQLLKELEPSGPADAGGQG